MAEISDALMRFIEKSIEGIQNDLNDQIKVNTELRREIGRMTVEYTDLREKYTDLLDEFYDFTAPTFDLAFVKKAIGYPTSSNIEAEYEKQVEQALAKDVGESGEAI